MAPSFAAHIQMLEPCADEVLARKVLEHGWSRTVVAYDGRAFMLPPGLFVSGLFPSLRNATASATAAAQCVGTRYRVVVFRADDVAWHGLDVSVD